MSAGKFLFTSYESDQGTLYPCKVQPETVAATIDGTANSAAAGPVPAGVPSANMRGSKRQNGITARRISLELADGATAPAGYSGGGLSIPILTNSLYAATSKGSTVVYLETTWRVSGKTPESVT